jgi:hypothetical protein
MPGTQKKAPLERGKGVGLPLGEGNLLVVGTGREVRWIRKKMSAGIEAPGLAATTVIAGARACGRTMLEAGPRNQLLYWRRDWPALAPYPLRKRLIEPTLNERLTAESLCSEPRLARRNDHLKEALQLDSSHEIARGKLVWLIIGSVNYSAHELPQGYLGDLGSDLTREAEEARSAASKYRPASSRGV